MDTFTSARPFYGGVQAGDRLHISGDTNRMRRRVIAVQTETAFDAALYLRPSKGYRRHVRRMKARNKK